MHRSPSPSLRQASTAWRATAAGKAEAAAEKAQPKPKAQRNFTDPESKIMKTSDGSFHQCYNAQAVGDAEHQVIVAADVSINASDVADLIPMTEQTTTNTGTAPGQMLADAGYCSADNLERANEYTDQHETEFFIATGRAPTTNQPRSRHADRSRRAQHPNSGWPAN